MLPSSYHWKNWRNWGAGALKKNENVFANTHSTRSRGIPFFKHPPKSEGKNTLGMMPSNYTQKSWACLYVFLSRIGGALPNIIVFLGGIGPIVTHYNIPIIKIQNGALSMFLFQRGKMFFQIEKYFFLWWLRSCFLWKQKAIVIIPLFQCYWQTLLE